MKVRTSAAVCEVPAEHSLSSLAFEEVGLPADPEKVRYLTTLPPFLSRSLLLVTPVVCFVLDTTLKVSSPRVVFRALLTRKTLAA